MYNSWWCLDSDDDHVDSHLNINGWKNSNTVIVLYKGIDKRVFDIRGFHPFISEGILKKAFHLQMSTIIYPMKI